jgi:hypothetical protein
MADSQMRGRYVDPSSCDEETAAGGYPPCEQGVTFEFFPEVGHIYRATARHSANELEPASRLFVRQNVSDTLKLTFKHEVNDPAFDLFSKRVSVNVDVPKLGEMPVLVRIALNGANTEISIDPVPANFAPQKDSL